jgi:hypothetical protein
LSVGVQVKILVILEALTVLIMTISKITKLWFFKIEKKHPFVHWGAGQQAT